MSVDQLIAKALSTTSEDEAIACLRMARKKGGRLDVKPTTVNAKIEGHDVAWWRDIAYQQHRYIESKKTHVKELQRTIRMLRFWVLPLMAVWVLGSMIGVIFK